MFFLCVSTCVRFMQKEPNFNLANYYSGELRGEVKWRAAGWSM